jgi:hypothetical protein
MHFHAGVCFLWIGWRKRRGLRFWLKRAEVLGQIETLGVPRCAQDDGKNLNSYGYGNCNCNCNCNCNDNDNGYCNCNDNCNCNCNYNGYCNGYGRFRSPLISIRTIS